MKTETLEKGNNLVNRYRGLRFEKEKLEREKAYSQRGGDIYLRSGDHDNVSLNVIDPSGELTKTIFVLVEAKLKDSMEKTDAEFEALKDD
jgi:hypothetical protein